MRWRTHNEPAREEGATALMAIRSDEQDLVLLGLYYWRGGRWLCEETGRPIRYARYWWIPEAELLAAIPRHERARLMSFSMTTEQFKARAKTITRRLGWWNLQPGDVLEGCEKCMGLKAGEKVKRLGRIRIVSTRAEPLNAITPDDVVREGFPGWTPERFVIFLARHYNVIPNTIFNRIEFEYL